MRRCHKPLASAKMSKGRALSDAPLSPQFGRHSLSGAPPGAPYGCYSL